MTESMFVCIFVYLYYMLVYLKVPLAGQGRPTQQKLFLSLLQDALTQALTSCQQETIKAISTRPAQLSERVTATRVCKRLRNVTWVPSWVGDIQRRSPEDNFFYLGKKGFNCFTRLQTVQPTNLQKIEQDQNSCKPR